MATTAIAVPVIIHLWNVKQSKTLKIGSISLLLQGSPQNARSLKLHDLWLLFLRCLLIALLAFILAKPVWQHPITNEKRGWVLIPEEDLNAGYSSNKVKIDSLLKGGYEFHYFNAGFQKDNLYEALRTKSLTEKYRPAFNRSYWSLLKELNQVASPGLSVVVFVQNNLSRFTGARPGIALDAQVHTYYPADTTAGWIAKAFLTPADSIHLLVGRSRTSGTVYAEKNLSQSMMSPAGYSLAIRKGKLMVSSKTDETGTDTSFVDVDTSTIRIVIFADKFRNDAKYVTAAIESITKFTKRKIQLSLISNIQKIPGGQDWIFWLSEQPMPAGIMAKNIFVYEKGKAENIHSWIVGKNETTNHEAPIEITKRIIQNTSGGLSENIWSDGFGKPVLSKGIENNSYVYRFYSRFDPEWNDLPWSEAFPKFVLELLFHQDNEDHYAAGVYDKRVIDERQAQPYIASSLHSSVKDKLMAKNDLSDFFWLAAIIIFFIERIISFKNRKAKSYG